MLRVPLSMLLMAVPVLAAPAGGEDFLEQYASTFRFTLGQPRAATPAPDGGGVYFLRSEPRDFVQDLYFVDTAGVERRILSAADLLAGQDETLTAPEKARRERQRLVARGIAGFEVSRDGRLLLVPLAGRVYTYAVADGVTGEVDTGGGGVLDPRLSPDGRLVAFVKDDELHVTAVAAGAPRALTSGAGAGISHGTAEFVAQEEMSRQHGFWWSPDSSHIVYQRTDTRALETMHIAEATHPERQPTSWPYPRPGRPNADVRLGIVSVGGGPPVWIEWDRGRYEYLAAVRWDDGGLRILLQNRLQTERVLRQVDPGDGSTTALLTETDPAWVEIDELMPRSLADGRFLWTTERNGFRELEIRNADGSPARSLTPPALGFRRFGNLFEQAGSVVVEAAADPSQSHLWTIPLAGGEPRRLTVQDGHHTMASPPGPSSLWVRKLQPVDGAARFEICDADGAARAPVASRAERPPFIPQMEFVRVGERDLRAVLVRPRDFSPDRRYPVIVHVYGGPTSLMVLADPSRYLLDQWFADRGFVVVAIDGRGTPHRGRDWQRAVKHDLIELPLADQVDGLQALLGRFPELDGGRVGIYGWSFGGYFSAMAVLRRPDVFDAAVAGAPVTDWQDYDTHYTERYMGLPAANPDGYRSTRVMTWADRLERPLLLVHGTADDNVYFMHSLKLADALFRAGRPFEFLPLPGFTHMVPDPLVTRRLYGRISEFFAEHLGAPAVR